MSDNQLGKEIVVKLGCANTLATIVSATSVRRA